MANIKDYLDFNKIMLGVITYLIVDLHQGFKEVVRDVQQLKIIVNEHSYRLNVKEPTGKKDVYLYNPLSEAILPDNLIKIKKENDKAKISNS
jgi:hypothetical protein